MGGFIGERLLEIRVVHGEQRPAAQLANEQERPTAPTSPTGIATSIQCIAATACPAASGETCRNDGATYQIKSTSRITSTKAAILASVALFFLRPAESSIPNGMKK